MSERTKVLFLCTGNSCRSQMAEGWVRHLKATEIEACSAGINPHELDPRAVSVMEEAGVDISSHRPRHLDDLAGSTFDYVVTVCDRAHEQCPIFPGGTKVVHIAFDDPSRLAESAGTDQEKLDCYRYVRDKIRTFVEGLPETLTGFKEDQ